MISISQSLQEDSKKIGLTAAQINIKNFGYHTLDAIKASMSKVGLPLSEAYARYKFLNYIQVEGMTKLGLSRDEVQNKDFNEISLRAIKISMKRGLSKDEAVKLMMIPVVQVHEKLNQFIDETKVDLGALSTFKEIRLIVYDGEGFGNQRAALTLMGKLRSLGFNGIFDVWCEDKEGAELMFGKKYRYNDEKLVTKKILAMLPRMNFIQDKLYKDKIYGQIRLSSLPHDFKTNQDFLGSLKPLDVCFSGAEDSNGYFHIEKKKTNIFNVKVYISLQPTNWTAGGGDSFMVDTFQVVMPLIGQKTSRLSCPQTFNLSASDLNGKELKIFKCLENPNINSQLVYGIYDRKGALSPQIQFQRIINAHLELEAKTKKTSVLLVPQKKLYSLLDDFNSFEVSVMDIDEIQQDCVELTKNKKIIILKTDSLSVHYFDHLLDKGTTLPAVIEGCSSVDFCESHGIPFLHGGSLYDPIHAYDFAEDGYEIKDNHFFLFFRVKEYAKFHDVQALHLNANRCLEQGDEACEPALVKYMLESLNANSKIFRYHRARYEKYMARPDAVENALNKVGIDFDREQENTFNDSLKMK